MTGLKNANRSLGAIALSSALMLCLGGLVMGADAVSGDQRGPVVNTAAPPGRVLQTSDMSVDPAQVVWIRAKNVIQFTGSEAIRPAMPTAPPMSLDPDLHVSPSNPWVYDHGADPRQGLYDPVNLNEFTSYCYENNSWFRLGSTGANAPPRTADILDVVQLAGSCTAPPVGIGDIDFCFRAISADPAYNFGVLFTFWDNFDITGPYAGGSVVDTIEGQALFDFGPIPTLVGFILCAQTPVTSPIYVSDPDVGVEVTYVDGVAVTLGSGTSFFALGPPRAEPYIPSNPPVGTSDQFFYYDQDLDGFMTTANRVSFANTVVNKGNIFLHLMGFQNPAETEVNDTQPQADSACLCSTRNAEFDSAGDVDWVKFTMALAGDFSATLDCFGNDTEMYLRDGGGFLITSNDDISGTNLCSSITASVAAGTYFLEIHDKGDNEAYLYDLIMKPIAGKVTNHKFSTTVIPAPKSVQTWDSQGSTAKYDVVRGNIQTLHTGGFCALDSLVWPAGNFENPCALPDCLFTDLASPTFIDITNPTSPADSLFYLVRGKIDCQGIGSYDEGGNQDHPRDVQILANLSANPCP